MKTKKLFTEIAQFQPKQREAWKMIFGDGCKYLLFGGAMGSGKSYFLRWAALGVAIYYAQNVGKVGVPVGLFSEDYPTLKDRQISKILHEFPPAFGELRGSQAEGLAFYIDTKYGGGRILLRNLDDPSKFMSTEFAAIFVDELTRNDESVFTNLRTRLRYPGIDKPLFVAATNPGGIGHWWVKKFWIDRNTGDIEQRLFQYIPATVTDNVHVPASYRTQLEALPERERKAYLTGDWDAFGAMFWTEMEAAKETVDPFGIPPEWPLVLGIDPGWSGVCAAILLAQDYTGKVYVVSVYYEAERNPDENAEAISGWIRTNPYLGGRMPWSIVAGRDAFAKKDRYAVIANEKTFSDIFQSHNLFLQPVFTERVQGWSNIRSLLPDRLFFFRGCCDPLIREMIAVARDERVVDDIQGRGNDPRVPDHAEDALRYAVAAIYRPVEQKEDSVPEWVRHWQKLSEQKEPESWSPGMI